MQWAAKQLTYPACALQLVSIQGSQPSIQLLCFLDQRDAFDEPEMRYEAPYSFLTPENL